MQAKSAEWYTAVALRNMFALFFFMALWLLPVSGMAAELEGQWYWQAEAGTEWQPFDFPHIPPLDNHDDKVWLKTTLPDMLPKDASLLMQSRDQAFFAGYAAKGCLLADAEPGSGLRGMGGR